jgi:hypothetical protein
MGFAGSTPRRVRCGEGSGCPAGPTGARLGDDMRAGACSARGDGDVSRSLPVRPEDSGALGNAGADSRSAMVRPES